MGAASGRDFGARFSRAGVAERLNQSYAARAFTVDRDIAFAAGQYHPETITGDALLAHELAHVVQQTGGSRGAKNAGTVHSAAGSLEREADTAAGHVVRTLWTRPESGIGTAGLMPLA
jgi:hypothetical protein